MGKYNSFRELKDNEHEGQDYCINVEDRSSPVVIMAPHGRRIEFFTCQLAKYIAKDNYSVYCFNGLKEKNNWDLHITSHKFDEPKAEEIVSKSQIALTIHGQGNKEECFLVVGGKDEFLRKKLEERLGEHYTLKDIEELKGKHHRNICNRTKRDKGGQLELSYKLRNLLKQNEKRRQKFVSIVRQTLDEAVKKI